MLYNSLDKVINVYTYLIERQMSDRRFGRNADFYTPAQHYLKIIDMKYSEDAEVIKNCIMSTLKHRYDEETIRKHEEISEQIKLLEEYEDEALWVAGRNAYHKFCNARKSLVDDYGGEHITFWKRWLPEFFSSLGRLNEVRLLMEERESQTYILWMSLDNLGVGHGEENAVKWFRKVAEQDNTIAQYFLGVIYFEGRGVTQDYKQAVKWCRQAAEQNHVKAQGLLGLMYTKGLGVTQDYKQAMKWLRKAAEQGDANAQISLAQVVNWFRKVAEQGDAVAQLDLARMYITGRGVTQDYKQAVKWCRKAAKQGDADAQFYLGWMYYDGQGVPQDDKQSVEWYRKAAEQGNADAQYNLGWMYRHGRGVFRSYIQAYMWWKIAAASEVGSGFYAKGRDAVAKKMTPSQIQEAQRLTDEWMTMYDK